MNRTATFHFKANAAAEYRGNGVWEAELIKGARSAKLTESQWQFSKTSTEEGVLAQQTFRVQLPDKVRNVAEATNELGKPVLRYELPQRRRANFLLPLAAVLAVLGIAVMGVGLTRGANQTRAPRSAAPKT